MGAILTAIKTFGGGFIGKGVSLATGLSLRTWACIAGAAAAALLLWLAYSWAYDRGYEARKAADDKIFAAYDKAAAKAEQEKQDTETYWASVVAGIQAKYDVEMKNAKAREDQLRADVDAGRRSLRISAARSGGGGMPGAPGTAASGDGETVELSAEARRAYFNLRDAIIRDAATLKACQAYVAGLGAFKPPAVNFAR